MSERTIGICIPTYNRVELLFNSFSRVIENENVSEVTIVDDCSDENIYEQIKERAKENDKIRLFRNISNRDCYFNKFTAISYSTKDWNILLDSDNEINFDYLFHIFQNIDWKEDTAYLPCRAEPHFDYTKYSGLEITKHNVAKYMYDPTFSCALNTANYFVNKKFYMKCWDGSIDPHTSDSIYMNYLWLKNGGKLYFVPGLSYQHRVDNHGTEEPGHYQSNNHLTGNFHSQVEQMLKELR